MSKNPGNDFDGRNGGEGEVRFHYSRNERLQKIRNSYRRDRGGPSKKRIRRIRFIIIGADLVFVFILFYFLSTPTNVYLEKSGGPVRFELNVTGMKGDRLLVGFSLQNDTEREIRLDPDTPVVLRLSSVNGTVAEERKTVGADALPPSDMLSVIFLLDRSGLPYSGTIELYYGEDPRPVFEKRIRM